MSENIIVLKLQNRGMPGTGISEIEKNQIASDLASLLGRPVIDEIADVPDVAISSPTQGDVLVFNSTANEWVNEPPSASLTVSDTDSVDLTLDGTELSAAVRFGGNGTASTASRADHWHRTDSIIRHTFGPTGYMSGGSRTLRTSSVPLVNGVQYLINTRLDVQVRGVDPGAAYYTMTISIDGLTWTSPGGSDGFWCVQGVPNKETWAYHRTINGTGASIPVMCSISYHSGAGFNVDAGVVEIALSPNV